MIYPEKHPLPSSELTQVLESLPVGVPLELRVAGENINGKHVEKTVQLPFKPNAITATDRLSSMGLTLIKDTQGLKVDHVEFGSPAEASGIEFDWHITAIIQDAHRPLKEWVFIPCLFILLLVALNQRRRIASNPSS